MASFLHALGVKIMDVRRNEAGKTIIVFENGDGETREKVLRFYNRNDTVSASALLNSFQVIRNIIFDPSMKR